MDLSLYRDFPTFKTLDDAQLASFAERCEEIVLSAGELFIDQASRGDCLYFVAEGRMKVFVKLAPGDETGDEHELAVLDAPAVVGEMEFLTGEPRIASVRSLATTRALKLTYDCLMERLEAGHAPTLQVFFQIAKVVARRLAAMDRKFAELEQQPPGTRFDELREFQHKLMSEWTF